MDMARKILAELHGDLFSRHASPLEVYVLWRSTKRREHFMSDEICRRCNGKQQGRRRGGRSVQLPDSFVILHSSSRHFMHVYIRTIITTKYIQRKKKKAPSEVRSRGWTCTRAKIQGVPKKKKNNTWYVRFSYGNAW